MLQEKSPPTDDAKRYHHGDLANALLDAGEAELAEKGIEGFSLRGVAKRAGVSHAAPAHHFKDANGLLTAIAARGYEKFRAAQIAREDEAGDDPVKRAAASGLGYVDFACANPALFRLMFSSDRPDFDNPRLHETAFEGFDALVRHVSAIRGKNPYTDSDAMLDVAAGWALAHGLADLLASGRLKVLQNMEKEARDRAVAGLIERAFQAPTA